MAQIEVDPQLEGDGSDYASSGFATDSTSLASSVNSYVFENGRRYHSYFGTDKNLMPTDEKEQDRMDIAHEVRLRLLNGKLHAAPLREKPHRILDVGTGTGIWAIDMADKHPTAEVVGIDLSPIQPGWVPPNCRFEVDDAELPWTFEDNTFDLIHMRNLDQGITGSNWPKVLTDAYRCLRPGGYIELSETGVIFHCDDGTMKPDNPAYHWSQLLSEAMTKAKRPAIVKGVLADRLSAARFEDIQQLDSKLPFGPWPKERRLKEVGCMALLGAESGFTAYGMAAFTRILELSEEEASKTCRDGLAAVMNKNYHLYLPHFVAYGRKPEKNNQGQPGTHK